MSISESYYMLGPSYEDVLSIYKTGDLEKTIMRCNFYIDYYENMEVWQPMPGLSDIIQKVIEVKNCAESGMSYDDFKMNYVTIPNIRKVIWMLIIMGVIIGIGYMIYLAIIFLYEYIVSFF